MLVLSRAFHLMTSQENKRCATGVENVSDHGTIGPRKFLVLPENILSFRSKKEFIGHT